MFSRNVGNVDRVFRVLLGIGGIVAGYYDQSYFWYAFPRTSGSSPSCRSAAGARSARISGAS